jgi:hypothetical protein
VVEPVRRCFQNKCLREQGYVLAKIFCRGLVSGAKSVAINQHRQLRFTDFVKVFRRRPSKAFPHRRGRRLKTSKGRNRGKGTYEEADPALHSTFALVPIEAVATLEDADATFASRTPFLTVAEPPLLLLEFAGRTPKKKPRPSLLRAPGPNRTDDKALYFARMTRLCRSHEAFWLTLRSRTKVDGC